MLHQNIWNTSVIQRLWNSYVVCDTRGNSNLQPKQLKIGNGSAISVAARRDETRQDFYILDLEKM